MQYGGGGDGVPPENNQTRPTLRANTISKRGWKPPKEARPRKKKKRSQSIEQRCKREKRWWEKKRGTVEICRKFLVAKEVSEGGKLDQRGARHKEKNLPDPQKKEKRSFPGGENSTGKTRATGDLGETA